MKYILVFLILTIIFADCYVVLPFIRLETMFAIFMYFCGTTKVVLYQKKEDQENVKKEKRMLLYALFAFLSYITIIDIYHGQFSVMVGTRLVELCFVICFVYLAKIQDNIKIIYIYIIFYIFYQLIFCIVQLVGSDITAGKLLSVIPFIGVERLYMGDTFEVLRISGAYNYCITLNIYLGCILTVLVFLTDYGNKTLKFFLIVSIIFMQYFTMTRSAIISMPVSILIGYFAFEKIFSLKTTLKILSIMILCLLFFYYIKGAINSSESRYLMYDDGSSINRYQVNIYACIGTFYKSPLIGIPYDEDAAFDAIMFGYSKLGLILQDTFTPLVTHHDEPAYYFRYYGFIGLFLYIYMYYQIVRYIFMCKEDIRIKRGLLAMIAFFFLYNLMHNAKLVDSFIVYLLLSLNISSDKTQEPA